MATQAVQKQVEDEQGVEEEDLLLPTEKIPGFDVAAEKEVAVETEEAEAEPIAAIPGEFDGEDFTEKVAFLKEVPKDVPKPEPVAPRDEKDEAYFEEHKGLPTEEELPFDEVAEREAQALAERKKAAEDIEAHKDDVGTIEGLEHVEEAQQTKPANVVVVEGILSEGLEDLYRSMTVDQQAEFRRVGETTAAEVAGMLDQAKIKFKEIIQAIATWLGLLPKVNKHFIEQESKIKLDHLLKYKKETEGTEME